MRIEAEKWRMGTLHGVTWRPVAADDDDRTVEFMDSLVASTGGQGFTWGDLGVPARRET